ncbi:hypothetical protein KAU11_08465 [Candidatus Babeliales bacterium]|nr:hypothetical protein [Candidatus Babeliales bacterium]
MGMIGTEFHKMYEPLIDDVEGAVNNQLLPIVLDTQRNVLKTTDNITSKAAYTVRDTKSELLHFLDSTFDNFAIIINHNLIHVIDTIQILSVISTSVLLLLIFLNYHHIQEKGISIGSFNIL